MSADRELIEAVRLAVRRAGPEWTAQASRLRRRLEEALGPQARGHRASVHLLVVAIEERIPVRLERHGWSPEHREELVGSLVASRGWTVDAADWTVQTWARVLNLADEPSPRPTGPTDVAASPTVLPDTARPATALPVSSPAPDTELPPSEPAAPPVSATVLPPEEPMAPAPPLVAATVLPADAPLAPVEPEPSPDAPRPLPTSRTAAWTKKATAHLGEPVDVAYPSTTRNPTIPIAVAAPIGVLGLVLGGLVGSGLLVAFWVVVLGHKLTQPVHVLAVQGDRVRVLSTRPVSYRPVAVVADVSRHEIRPGRGAPFSSIQVEDHERFVAGRIAAALPLGPRVDAS